MRVSPTTFSNVKFCVVTLSAACVKNPSMGVAAYYNIKYNIRFHCQFVVDLIVEFRFT
jgi:hypothetical protein